MRASHRKEPGADLGVETFHSRRQRYIACREAWRRERTRRVPEV